MRIPYIKDAPYILKWALLLTKRSNNKFFLFTLFLSIIIHFSLFKNTLTFIDESKPDLPNNYIDIYFFENVINPSKNKFNSIPQEIKGSDSQLDKHGLKENKALNVIKEIDNSDFDFSITNSCDKCFPESKNNDVNEQKNFGEEVNNIQMRFKVFHDVGPNKKQNINPLGQTSFKDNLNSSKNHIGHVNIIFNKINDHYKIEFVTEINPIASIYLNNLYQKSEGIIDKKGLVPSKYTYAYGEKINNNVYFDWEKKELKIETKSKNLKYHLEDNAQDQLSVLFNFMFLDPLKKMNIYVTNGKKLKIYDYSYIEDGKYALDETYFDFIQISKNSDNGDKLDLFLAKDYGFLPLKILNTNKDLSYISQELVSFQINGIKK